MKPKKNLKNSKKKKKIPPRLIEAKQTLSPSTSLHPSF